MRKGLLVLFLVGFLTAHATAGDTQVYLKLSPQSVRSEGVSEFMSTLRSQFTMQGYSGVKTDAEVLDDQVLYQDRLARNPDDKEAQRRVENPFSAERKTEVLLTRGSKPGLLTLDYKTRHYDSRGNSPGVESGGVLTDVDLSQAFDREHYARQILGSFKDPHYQPQRLAPGDRPPEVKYVASPPLEVEKIAPWKITTGKGPTITTKAPVTSPQEKFAPLPSTAMVPGSADLSVDLSLPSIQIQAPASPVGRMIESFLMEVREIDPLVEQGNYSEAESKYQDLYQRISGAVKKVSDYAALQPVADQIADRMVRNRLSWARSLAARADQSLGAGKDQESLVKFAEATQVLTSARAPVTGTLAVRKEQGTLRTRFLGAWTVSLNRVIGNGDQAVGAKKWTEAIQLYDRAWTWAEAGRADFPELGTYQDLCRNRVVVTFGVSLEENLGPIDNLWAGSRTPGVLDQAVQAYRAVPDLAPGCPEWAQPTVQSRRQAILARRIGLVRRQAVENDLVRGDGFLQDQNVDQAGMAYWQAAFYYDAHRTDFVDGAETWQAIRSRLAQVDLVVRGGQLKKVDELFQRQQYDQAAEGYHSLAVQWRQFGVNSQYQSLPVSVVEAREATARRSQVALWYNQAQVLFATGRYGEGYALLNQEEAYLREHPGPLGGGDLSRTLYEARLRAGTAEMRARSMVAYQEALANQFDRAWQGFHSAHLDALGSPAWTEASKATHSSPLETEYLGAVAQVAANEQTADSNARTYFRNQVLNFRDRILFLGLTGRQKDKATTALADLELLFRQTRYADDAVARGYRKETYETLKVASAAWADLKVPSL